MSSNINPSNINGSYPIAGQDNDSQGFRDNFTNIRTNLTYAQKEIEDLQNKAVLKAPLAGSTTTTVSNNLTGVGLTGATVAEFVEYANFDDTPVLNDLLIEFSKGHLHKYIAGGNLRLDLGWGAVVSGTYAKMRLWITIPHLSYTITFPESITVGLDRILGVTDHLFVAPQVGEYLFEFSTIDAGSNVVISSVSTVANDGAAIPAMLGNIAILQSNVSTLQGNVTTLENNDSILFSSVSTLQTGLAATNSHLASNVTTLNSSITSNVAVLNNSISTLNLDRLTDVSIVSPTPNSSLRYQPTGEWANVPYSGELVIYEVTVVDTGNGIQEIFALNGVMLPAMSPKIRFKKGDRYRFDLSDVSNAGAPLRFSTTPDTAVPLSIIPYTTGVTVSGTAGTAGSYIEITITESTPTTLYLYGDETGTMIDTSKVGAEYPIETGIDCCFNGSNAIISGNAVDLTTSVSYFTSAGTATLSTGKNGQVKVIASSTAASATIAVTNYAWTGTGVITLNASGAACTLQYIAGKWFCIGNNGAVFS